MPTSTQPIYRFSHPNKTDNEQKYHINIIIQYNDNLSNITIFSNPKNKKKKTLRKKQSKKKKSEKKTQIKAKKIENNKIKKQDNIQNRYQSLKGNSCVMITAVYTQTNNKNNTNSRLIKRKIFNIPN